MKKKSELVDMLQNRIEEFDREGLVKIARSIYKVNKSAIVEKSSGLQIKVSKLTVKQLQTIIDETVEEIPFWMTLK